MHGRDRPASLWIGCLLVGVMAGPALAQDPQAVGEHTGLQRGTNVQCASLNDPDRRPSDPCPDDGQAPQDEYEKRKKAQEEREKPKHSSFLRWLHTDALWIPTESGNQSFGLVGAHLAVARVGRLHIFGPPGVLVLRQRTRLGWQFRPALTWGMSIFLTDMRIPGTTRTAQLFGNLTKCWTQGDQRTGMSMAGLSITWKK